MWLKLTSHNSQEVWIKKEEIEIIEGIENDEPYIIGEEREPGGAKIVTSSGNVALVKEAIDIVIEKVKA